MEQIQSQQQIIIKIHSAEQKIAHSAISFKSNISNAIAAIKQKISQSFHDVAIIEQNVKNAREQNYRKFYSDAYFV
jgi:hypothetical protein